MQIFQAEIDDGVAGKVHATSSVCYASVVEPVVHKMEKSEISSLKSLASVEDSDLYYVQSILVTSSWNKNDDIFDKAEVWLAKDTPEDKPTNLEHDESVIIGHITSNWPITTEGQIIDPKTPVEDLPNKYHILTGSVVYRGFSQPELKARAENLIHEIESGSKFVSMECFFKGFDYGLINKSTGEYHVLPRSETTAHLTKYLRAYGGMGEHQDYKIGRVLRNITFSGKGFVDKPANPDSIIFTKDSVLDKKNNNLTETGVSMNKSTSNTETIEMSSETEIVENEVVTATPVSEEVVADATPAAQEDVQASIDDLTTRLAEAEAAMKKQGAEMKKKEEDMKKKEEMMKKTQDEAMMKMKAELDAAHEAIAAYKMKEAEMAKKEKKMKRMAALTDLGVSNEVAASTVDKFETIDDVAFEAIANLIASQQKTVTEPTVEASETAPVADVSALENVEVEEEVNLGVGSEDTSANSTRAELVEFVCARLGKKLNKGE